MFNRPDRETERGGEKKGKQGRRAGIVDQQTGWRGQADKVFFLNEGIGDRDQKEPGHLRTEG